MDAAGAERAVAALAASQHSALGRRQAASLGFTWRMAETRLRSGVLSEPTPGVLVFTAARKTWHQDLMVATLAGADALASHRAAAALQHLDPFSPGDVEVLVERGRHYSARGVTVHRGQVEACDRLRVEGIPCTNIARTLCDLGSVVEQDVVEQALDCALRRGVSERWIRETLVRLDRPGPSGTHTLRRILDLPDRAGALPDSWFERLVERMLARSALPPPVRQHRVCETGGTRVAYLDLAWPDLRLAVEPSGMKAHGGAGNTRRDHARDRWLAVEGWEVVYVQWADRNDSERLCREIERIYLQRLRATVV